jgi:hypothetical protein
MKPATRWKIAGTLTTAIPVAFFLAFAIGEGLRAGWAHYVQAAVPAAALLLAWRRPRVGGAALVGAGLILAIAWGVAASSQPVATVVFVELVAFAPMIVGGCLFRRAAAAQRSLRGPAS